MARSGVGRDLAFHGAIGIGVPMPGVPKERPGEEIPAGPDAAG